MLLRAVVDASDQVGETRARTKKVGLLAAVLRAASADELPLVAGMLAGQPRQGKIGVGWALASKIRKASAPAAESSITVHELDARFDGLAEISGKGSTARREAELGGLLGRATESEQSFIVRLLLGELRQGALEALVIDAIASACETDKAVTRRAMMLCGDLGRVATTARTGGDTALGGFALQLFRPIQPMLAQPTDGIAEALEELGESSLEYKLDGARVQIHKQGERVEVYTRKLNVVTAAVPELVEAVRAMPVQAAIFDGEAIAMRDDGKPHPFQTTMRRFGRKLDVETIRAELPLTVRLFDCLRAEDETLIDVPGSQRWDALAAIAPEQLVVPRIVPRDAEDGAAFVARALQAGHEGVMAKSLQAPYEAGKRGKGWRKLKPVHTLDLVVLAVEWGSGRRKGWLSNLHLGARDPAAGGFVMLGKTFKGMTDAMLQWQTDALLARKIGEEQHVVHVRPELVVEVAFNDVQASPHYPAGLALRFARVKRYREDKTASEADTIESVRAIFRAATA